MVLAIAITTVLACIIGLPLVCYGGWALIGIGVLCVVFCFLYTVVLSYIGLGDVLVLVFFGLVPVCATYYIQMGTLQMDVLCSSVACGLVIDTLLVVNNYRDRDNDRRAGKMTLVIRIGERASEYLFLALGVVACVMGLVFLLRHNVWVFVFSLPYLFLHVHTYRKMKRMKHGKALNLILGENARNMFVYGLLFCLGVLFDYFI